MGKLGKLLNTLLRHPDELPALARMAYEAKKTTRLPEEPNLRFCYHMLNLVSRSFAIVIQQLPKELRDAICVFYLVLRALDTVEDDMKVPTKTKVPLLRDFYKKLEVPDFVFECGDRHYVTLMKEYPKVLAVYAGLKKPYKEVISDITRRMGNGMADFIESEVVTLKDWDLYCHYVAGLVGIGLSNLFAGSGLEDSRYRKLDTLSNHMGLLLQKTNIIRDYLEDIMEEPRPRMFWPKDVWSKHAPRLEDFASPSHRPAAVACLNELITNAMAHVPHCLEYMAGLRDPQVFRFCAIPQIMAIATLALCYNNGAVFEGVVKMRRGLTARVMLECDTIDDVYRAFAKYTDIIVHKARSLPPSPPRDSILAAARQAGDACRDALDRRGAGRAAGTVLGRAIRLVLFILLSLFVARAFFPAELARLQGQAAAYAAEGRARLPGEARDKLDLATAAAASAARQHLGPLAARAQAAVGAAAAAGLPVEGAAAAVLAVWSYVGLMKALPDPIN